MSASALIVGYGDIGQRVARRGLDAGCNVSALVRSPRAMGQVTAVAGDLDDDLGQAATLHELAVASASVLFHFAPPSSSGECDIRTAHLLAALEQAPPARIIYISTSGVYGDCAGAWVDEIRPVNPGNARSRRRVDAERQLAAFATRHLIPLLILRVPGIYGAGRYPLQRLQRGDPVICPDDAPWSNRIHADDLAAIAWRAAQPDAPPGIYNASDDAPSSMTDYFYQLADAFRLPRPPCVSLDAARRSFSPSMLEYLNESRRLDNQRMKDVLGVRLLYPTLAQGLASCRGEGGA
ncbi:MAG: SDR family oxidoreductase [Halothiobacillaceae bacterium]|nr:SDR family oxidoreductase [Halothiobacillaceae bacterium]